MLGTGWAISDVVINGATLAVLAFGHPQFGVVSFAMDDAGLKQLQEWIEKYRFPRDQG